MKSMQRFLIMICMVFAFVLPAWSAGNDYGPGSFFTYQGAGARANGMGGAFVALADDVMAGFWNPAGLAQLQRYTFELGLEFSVLALDRSSGLVSGAFRIPKAGTCSLIWMNNTMGNIEGRDELGEVSGEFSNAENMLLLSYGQRIFSPENRISMGVSAKMLQQSVDKYKANGWGFDIGLMWQPSKSWGHTVGVNVQNLLQSLRWDDTDTVDVSPVNIKAGVALKFLPDELEGKYNHLIITSDVNQALNQELYINVGAEYWYIESLGVRAGYSGNQELTAGLTYRAAKVEIDYAYNMNLANEFSSEVGEQQHRISLLMRFGSHSIINKSEPEVRTPNKEISEEEQVEPVEQAPGAKKNKAKAARAKAAMLKAKNKQPRS